MDNIELVLPNTETTNKRPQDVDPKVLSDKLSAIRQEIKEQYLADDIPWVIGFSGGRDSTALLQLVFEALGELPTSVITKPVHVVSNDTLVENPKVVEFLDKQLDRIRTWGTTHLFKHDPDLFFVQKTTPKPNDTFWVNLIGRGYPSPTQSFRWCTSRLKIEPTNAYILKQVNTHGSAIILLGTRRDESKNRAQSMDSYKVEGSRLRNHILPNAFVFAPLADITNHEVWRYLMDYPNMWSGTNQELVLLYYKSFDIQECPLVIDTTTPSCGNSRFGCWTCTVVSKDKSLMGMVLNGDLFMQSLLDLRDWIQSIRSDKSRRLGYLRNGATGLGPYNFETRKEILERLLIAEIEAGIPLISPNELSAIQLQWHTDGDFQYSVSAICDAIKGDTSMVSNKRNEKELEILMQVCQKFDVDVNLILLLRKLEERKLTYTVRKNLFVEMKEHIELFLKKKKQVQDNRDHED